jgi:hypothetical protein
VVGRGDADRGGLDVLMPPVLFQCGVEVVKLPRSANGLLRTDKVET